MSCHVVVGRTTARQLWLVGLTAVLVAIGASPIADSALPGVTGQRGGTDLRGELPECTVARSPSTAPTGRPGRAPTCRARPTRVLSARSGLPRPVPGYHHLGATSGGEWSGVLGRLTVRDAAVRAGTHDFVATRFMAKRQVGDRVSWLEAGWAETGWSGGDRQRIYTFDTNRNAWTFYDQYALRDGEQVWIYLHTEAAGRRAVWQAWLWWGSGWHLLTAEELPLGGRAQVEQYVEVVVDTGHGGPGNGSGGFAVPSIAVDNVQVKTAPDGGLRYWREEIPTAPGASGGRYCLDWQTRYDTWAAGDCPTP